MASTAGAQNRILLYSGTLLIHVVNSVVMFYCLHFSDVMQKPDSQLTLFRIMSFRFITIWNLIFQMSYAFLSLSCELYDLIQLKQLQKLRLLAEKIRNLFFCGVVWPVSFAIFTIFWPIYIYDRELIFPAYIDKVLSQWSNHAMHTSILFIVLAELAYNPRKAGNHWAHLKMSNAVYFCYIIVLFYTEYQHDAFPYPILKMFTGTQLAIFLAFIYVLTMFVYTLQWILTPTLKNYVSEKVKKNL